MTELTKEQANARVAGLISDAMELINMAESIAIEHKLSFSVDIAYGMGGTFDGAAVGEPDEWGNESDGWYPSSQSC